MTAARRALYEAHKKTATEALERRKAALVAKKLDKKGQKRDPMFRKLQAEIKQFDRRLAALAKTDAVNADLETRRAERAARPKVKKEKKKKAAPAAKPKREKKEKPAAG